MSRSVKSKLEWKEMALPCFGREKNNNYLKSLMVLNFLKLNLNSTPPHLTVRVLSNVEEKEGQSNFYWVLNRIA